MVELNICFSTKIGKVFHISLLWDLWTLKILGGGIGFEPFSGLQAVEVEQTAYHEFHCHGYPHATKPECAHQKGGEREAHAPHARQIVAARHKGVAGTHKYAITYNRQRKKWLGKCLNAKHLRAPEFDS